MSGRLTSGPYFPSPAFRSASAIAVLAGAGTGVVFCGCLAGALRSGAGLPAGCCDGLPEGCCDGCFVGAC